MKRSGIADLPLHGGRVPQWLAERMTRARHRDHRERSFSDYGASSFPLALERSVLVPGVGRGDGHGLALLGHHDIRHGRAEARARAARGRARPLRLRRSRQVLAQHAARAARDRRAARLRRRSAGAHQPADRAGRQQRDRRRIPNLSAQFRRDGEGRMGRSAAGLERPERHGAPLPLALGVGARFRRRAAQRHRRRESGHDHEFSRRSSETGANCAARHRPRKA